VVRVAVFVSGGGTNLQAIIDAKSIRSAEIALVVADNPNAFALQRAATAGIPGIALRRGKPFNTAVLPHLQSYKIDLIVLAGFLTIIDDVLIKAYPHRIMNVHPSLVPAFAGKGFYGLKVHAAALAKGVRYTGATVHFVTGEIDDGPIILQKPVAVAPDDTPESLQQRVMKEAEWQILPQAIEMFASGKLRVEGKIVKLKQKENWQ
jgi:phosphoribosylglycinamide formyltransferase-1